MFRLIELDQSLIEKTLAVDRRRGCSIKTQIDQLAQQDLQSLISSEDGEVYENGNMDNQTVILKYTNNDFLGYLKNKNL